MLVLGQTERGNSSLRPPRCGATDPDSATPLRTPGGVPSGIDQHSGTSIITTVGSEIILRSGILAEGACDGIAPRPSAPLGRKRFVVRSARTIKQTLMRNSCYKLNPKWTRPRKCNICGQVTEALHVPTAHAGCFCEGCCPACSIARVRRSGPAFERGVNRHEN